MVASSRLLPFLASLLVAGLPASASLLEDASGGEVSYQFDAGTFHDAPDSCAAALTPPHDFLVPVNGTTDAWLVPAEDEDDFLFVDVTAGMVGARMTVSTADALAGYPMSVNVWMPECGGSIFDPPNQPIPRLDPSPVLGQVQAVVGNLVATPAAPSWFCVPGLWSFYVTKTNATVAPSIHPSWSDGSQTDLAPAYVTSTGIAIYATTDHVAYTLHNVTVNLPSGWDGVFRVATGPCGATDGGAVFGPAPVQVGNRISFTPVKAGRHFLAVHLESHGVPDPTQPRSIPVSCHWCIPGAKMATFAVAYTASARLDLVRA